MQIIEVLRNVYGKNQPMIKWCDYCGKKFEAIKETAKFCSNACRTKAYRKRNGLPAPDFTKLTSLRMPSENERQYLLLKDELNAIMLQELAYERNYKLMLRKFEEAIQIMESSPSSWSRDNLERRKKEFYETKEKLTEQQKKRVFAEETIRSMRRNLDKERIVAGVLTASAEELIKLECTTLDFQGNWLKFFGNPQDNFLMIIGGDPKSGKSTLALVFSNYLKKFGNVVYIASDEKFGNSLQRKIIAYKINGIQFSKAINKHEISNVLAGSDYDFVVIDSLNQACMSYGDLEELRFIYPNAAFIIILQVTRAREQKTNHLFKHVCDIFVDVSDGIAEVKSKNYPPLEFDIFDQVESY